MANSGAGRPHPARNDETPPTVHGEPSGAFFVPRSGSGGAARCQLVLPDRAGDSRAPLPEPEPSDDRPVSSLVSVDGVGVSELGEPVVVSSGSLVVGSSDSVGAVPVGSSGPGCGCDPVGDDESGDEESGEDDFDDEPSFEDSGGC